MDGSRIAYERTYEILVLDFLTDKVYE